MSKLIRLSLLFSLVFAFNFVCWSQEKLVLIGGGSRPPAALEKFAQWANNDQILVVAWASGEPEVYAEALKKEFAPYFTGKLDFSNHGPTNLEEQNAFLDQLAKATGVFFTGGDQNKIMDALGLDGGNILAQKIKAAYASGVVFGGTSAGTAIMSETIITGDILESVTPLREGLGLLSSEIIVDQHFSQRKRRQRLLSALNQTQKDIGIGVDEDTALLVTDKENYEVLGKNKVKVFTRKNESSHFHKETFSVGDSFSF